jgi:hypothetical protein
VRIAAPILLVSTPIGVVFGLREAWRLAGPGMAVLMAVMLGVVGALVWWTVQRIRLERARERELTSPSSAANRGDFSP